VNRDHRSWLRTERTKANAELVALSAEAFSAFNVFMTRVRDGLAVDVDKTLGDLVEASASIQRAAAAVYFVSRDSVATDAFALAKAHRRFEGKCRKLLRPYTHSTSELRTASKLTTAVLTLRQKHFPPLNRASAKYMTAARVSTTARLLSAIRDHEEIDIEEAVEVDQVAVVHHEGVLVRTRPAVDHPGRFRVRMGERVQVTKRLDEWAAVTFERSGDQEYWVRARFLTPD
jgi:hypothetical protein